MNRQQHDIQTRRARATDAHNIAGLINVAFREAEAFFIEQDRIDLESVVAFLEAGEFLMAEINEDLVGCVYLEQRGERTYLGLLSVNPAYQNAGVGSFLMAAAEARCKARSSRFIDILIVNLREDLPAFYRKRGYLETGTSEFPADIQTKVPCHFINMSKSLAE